MRVHITLAEDVVRQLDRRVGKRQRSSFISRAVEEALDDDRRWEAIQRAIGSVPDTGHDWDADPAEWVRRQRRSHSARVG
ncbi:MAG: hypothetical protein QOH61_1402 [Chloroflexota bacterium]|jgi:hypothetical protein|nr:hypothetical protein [Chloroflexota bacterium]